MAETARDLPISRGCPGGVPKVRCKGVAAPRPTHPLIRRVKDWTEVEEALAALAVRAPL